MSNYWDFTTDKSKRRLSDLWRPYRDNHKYGFKDHKGNIVLPAQYNQPLWLSARSIMGN